ncbi:hypothetical protein SAMN05192583_1718 [Sphingomonas gellani]|uniref:Uncharacterized protein n=1 Tax=Sphingomonas gellani TaxID=1166340 RepID=A0A1H8CQ91_9SPHN|nr:hypothetical protein [Sphingomonas gellani]SEM97421.1 hypothetical protein SAMN05192583_1718 [Sphingomonas gellani]
MSTLSVTRIKVAVDLGDADGLLVMHEGALVAVLVCLDDDFYGSERGRWHLEAGFGRCGASVPTFETIAAALRWIADRLELDDESVRSALASVRPAR